MKTEQWIFSLIPSALLIIGGAYTFYSGNDKASYMMLSLALFNIFYALIGMLLACMGKGEWKSVCIMFFPTFYFISIVILGRMGLIDTLPFIGFR